MEQLNRSAQYTTFRPKSERLRALNWTKADSCRIHDRTKLGERQHISSRREGIDKSANRTLWNGRAHTRVSSYVLWQLWFDCEIFGHEKLVCVKTLTFLVYLLYWSVFITSPRNQYKPHWNIAQNYFILALYLQWQLRGDPDTCLQRMHGRSSK